jgi:hypothetical protein
MKHDETRTISKISLSPEERDLILGHVGIGPELAQRLRLGTRAGNLIEYSLDEDLFGELMVILAYEGARGTTRAIRRRFQRLEKKLAPLVEALDVDEPEDNLPSALPSELQHEIRTTFASEEFKSLDDANDALRNIVDRHNQKPREEFQGLSSNQVANLIYTVWNAPDSPIQLNSNLSHDDFADATILHNAHIFLNALAEAPIKTTVSGNLIRAFVARMFEEMILDAEYREASLRMDKVRNEHDVWPLHILRVVLGQAGLIQKRKGYFRITQKGKALIPVELSGELYFSLFMAFFSTFNLAYLDRWPSFYGIQETLAYSLNALDQHKREWIPIEKLKEVVFLPSVRDELSAAGEEWDVATSVATSRLVNPLESFGLLECFREQGKYFKDIRRVRAAPLFEKFVTVKP